VLYEQNFLEEASHLIKSSIAHNELWNNPNHVAHAYMVQARILMGQGDSATEEALKRAKEAADHPAVVQTLRMRIDALSVQLWLATGREALADRWAETHPLAQASGNDTEIFDMEKLAHIRVLIALGNHATTQKILDEVEKAAREAGRVEILIQTLILKALAASTQSSARKALEAALELGIPEGYRRIFLEEGDKLLSLLDGMSSRPDLVKPLLGSRRDKTKEVASVLTARELDILREMAEGLSNKEIGKRLFISAGTVKAHSAAIYRKLEVENRTEAIARAKDLDLI
jgi:LuxR family transcriptional regulator, maltose regulon positive regulatory protein